MYSTMEERLPGTFAKVIEVARYLRGDEWAVSPEEFELVQDDLVVQVYETLVESDALHAKLIAYRHENQRICSVRVGSELSEERLRETRDTRKFGGR